MSPPAGPTVRFPLAVPSYFVVNALRGLTGEVADAAAKNLQLWEILTDFFWIFVLPDSVVVLGCAETGRWFCVASRVVFSLIVAASIVFCLLKLLLLKKARYKFENFERKTVKFSHCVSLGGSCRWIWRRSVRSAIGCTTCGRNGLICSCENKFNVF